MKLKIKKIIGCWAVLIIFIPISLASTSRSPKPGKSLEHIYQTGKIEFVPELIITLDSFPERVYAKSINRMGIWKDNVYLIDYMLSNINVFSTAGYYIKTIGQRGQGPGDLLSPHCIVCTKDKLVVWEFRNKRFSTFTPAGKFIKTFPKSKRGAFLMDIKSLENGKFIVEWLVRKRNLNKFLEKVVLELYTADFEYIKPLYEKQVRRYKYLNFDIIPLPLQPDVSWDVLPGNKVVIGYSANYQIEIHDTVRGKTKHFTHPYTPVKVTEADKKFYFDSLVVKGSDGKTQLGADQVLKENTEFPVNKPAFKKIMTDCEGNILIFTNKETEKGIELYKGKSFDTFDSKGNYIKHVEILLDGGLAISNLISARDNVFWALTEVDRLELGVVKYRVK
jgi:hypothetical protein